MYSRLFANVGLKKPLVHSINNYVTANDVANAILAVGGSPVMADYYGEAPQITAAADALNINLGTPDPDRVRSMLLSGIAANEKNIPVILDLVGAGATDFRRQSAAGLLDKIRFSVIKGNTSEIGSVLAGRPGGRGVDSAENGLELTALQDFARERRGVIVVTGKNDVVCNGERAVIIENGSPLMGRLTGTGCMLSGVIAAFAGANPGEIFPAAALAVAGFGTAGEQAEKRLKPGEGTGSFRGYILDSLFGLTYETVKRTARYEIK